ncbi:MAG TPA: hypothetical protein VM425_01595 [Myxococcota bacterium]|nr:hypothetical protein [Myxococcota bacterium]
MLHQHSFDGPQSELEALLVRWHQYLSENGLTGKCDVNIDRRENWFILDGWVDSFKTKCCLLDMIPEINGSRWIVDRIRIGRPLCAC